MFSYIDELRKKPIEERRQLATSFTFFAVLIVAALWLSISIVYQSFFDPGEEPPQEVNRVNTSGITGPYDK